MTIGSRRVGLPVFTCMVFLSVLTIAGNLTATDYFLTIGGGYNASGNQASLEANVLFFQQLLEEKYRATRQHDVFFADGDDVAADLQVLAAKSTSQDRPATDLLAALHRRRGEERVEYRNHRVPNIAGPLNPNLVHASLTSLAKRAREGDRLIVYVTAHGSPGPKNDELNTTIDCWNEKKITAREFAGWMNELSQQVPVVMVMAQCYCGGFARTIFDELDPQKGLSPHLRAGFFAQQHNLPAAGCRPDIEHDEEFSSYFWGAIAGRSRTGNPVEGVDIDKDGRVSFAEAFAYAVWAGETIDIPLRTSDIFLRTYSRMSINGDATSALAEAKSETEQDAELDSKSNVKPTGPSQGTLNTALMKGTLQTFVDRGRPVSGQIISHLSKTLGFSLDDDVSKVLGALEEHLNGPRPSGPGRGGRRGGGGSGRRDLLREIGEKWPELADERHWEESQLLKPANQEQLFAELTELPAYKTFNQRRKQIALTGDQSGRNELREVKFRRLIKTLELVILEQNLPLIATPDIVNRYQQLISLEESTLQSSPTSNTR